MPHSKIHREADRIEPRVARAVLRAAGRLRALIPVAALLEALEAGDARLANQALGSMDIADAYEPLGKIVSDTVIRGAKL